MEVERRRGPRRDGVADSLSLHSFFFFFPPEAALFQSSLFSHTGTGSLTARTTELDGFDLLWLDTPLPCGRTASTYHDDMILCEAFRNVKGSV